MCVLHISIGECVHTCLCVYAPASACCALEKKRERNGGGVPQCHHTSSLMPGLLGGSL